MAKSHTAQVTAHKGTQQRTRDGASWDISHEEALVPPCSLAAALGSLRMSPPESLWLSSQSLHQLQLQALLAL